METLKCTYWAIGAILILFTTIFMIYEIVLQLNDDPYDDLNYNIYRFSITKYFFINFLWGCIIGHLLLGVDRCYILKDPYGFILIIIICLIMIIIGKVKPSIKISSMGRVILFLIGIVFGHFFWSMNIISY